MISERYTDIPYQEASEIVAEVFDIYTNLRLITNEEYESLYTGQNFENELVDTTRSNSVEDKVLRNLDRSTPLHKFNKEMRFQISKLNEEERTVINLIYYDNKTNEQIAEVMDYSVMTIRRRRENGTKKLAYAFKNSEKLKELRGVL